MQTDTKQLDSGLLHPVHVQSPLAGFWKDNQPMSCGNQECVLPLIKINEQLSVKCVKPIKGLPCTTCLGRRLPLHYHTWTSTL